MQFVSYVCSKISLRCEQLTQEQITMDVLSFKFLRRKLYGQTRAIVLNFSRYPSLSLNDIPMQSFKEQKEVSFTQRINYPDSYSTAKMNFIKCVVLTFV